MQQAATFSALAYGPFGDTGRPERSFAKFQLCTAIGVEQMPLQSEQIVIKLLPLHCIESISNASICLLKSCQSSAPCRIKDRCHETVCVCILSPRGNALFCNLSANSGKLLLATSVAVCCLPVYLPRRLMAAEIPPNEWTCRCRML